MIVVRTLLMDGERDCVLMPLSDLGESGMSLKHPLATIGQAVIGIRQPADTDWVNGTFVGDHDEPTDGSRHVHGEP